MRRGWTTSIERSRSTTLSSFAKEAEKELGEKDT